MTKAYEQKLLVNILYDTRRIFKDDKSITENYYDCWCYLNEIIDSNDAYICVSRPRRFGKTMAANMIAAYYSKGCDSHEIFSDL